MEIVNKLKELLPQFEEIERIVENEAEAGYILKMSLENIAKPVEGSATEETSLLLQALVDCSWERIHTGHFSEVPLNIRKIYALANYLKIFHLLLESEDIKQVEKCSEAIDKAALVGCTKDLYPRGAELKAEMTTLIDERLSAANPTELLCLLKPQKRRTCPSDIPQVTRPSVEDFRQRFFAPLQPALLEDTISHWPAMKRWRNLNYLLRVAGNRTVPIEIGANYAHEAWSQQLVKIRDFLRRQFACGARKAALHVEYLAQHELFDQIPDLKADIRVPDYCSLGSDTGPVDIKAWLGPKGTVSPLHYDPKHNLLCQVFGSKDVILAAPEDSPKLYPYEGEFLSNTSQIDAAAPDFERFPLAKEVRLLRLTLQEGDCLYLPPKWWHYVRSRSESFSVSFWWE